MSESPFPSSDAETADPEVDPGSRRRTLVAGGALAAVVLAAGAFFLLGGNDAAEQELAAPSGAPAAAPAPSASPSTLPVASKIELGRNPFKALYVQPAAAPATSATSAPSAPPTGGTTGSTGSTTGSTGRTPSFPVPQLPTTSPPPAPSTGSGTGSGTGSLPPAPVSQQKLQLVSAKHVGEEHLAIFKIDGVQQTVKVGETFGPTKHLLLVSLQQGPADDQWTAVVQVGDGDPFDVVTGSPVFVQ